MTLTWFQAIVYGIVQGVAEFLPISSSGHLIAMPMVFGWPQPSLAFDVALHLGTLVAVVLFFWKDWIRLIRAGFTKPTSTDGKLFWFVAAASIPGAIIGKLFEEKAESQFQNLFLIGTTLIVMGIILYLIDRYCNKKLTLDKIGFGRSFLIGLSQAIAIVPGISRAGITMTTAIASGLTREAAARFSFLLSTPIILGAGILKAKDLFDTPPQAIPMLIVSILVAAITGIISIKFLLEYLKNKGFAIFAIYRFIVGGAFILIAILQHS